MEKMPKREYKKPLIFVLFAQNYSKLPEIQEKISLQKH